MSTLLASILSFARRLAAVAAMLLASTCLSLLLLEAAVRLWDGVPLTSTDNFVARELNTVVGHANPAAEYDPRLGWVHVPYGKVGELIFGAYGVRMPSHEVVPLQQGAVLVVGDSFGAGSEVRSGESWPAQLEGMIGTQVINAAVGGYGFDQIVLRAEGMVPLLKPKVLLVQTRLGFGIDIARISIYGGAPKPYFLVRGGKLVLENEPVPRGASTRADIGRLRSVLGHSYLVQYVMTRLNLLQWWVAESLRTKYVESTAQAVDVVCLLMPRLAELRDRFGVRVALVFQYAATEGLDPTLGWEADRDRIMSCAAEENLDVVDTLHPLRSFYGNHGLSPYQHLWMMHDNDRVYGHMSPAGNRLIASEVFRLVFGGPRSEATAR